MEQLFDILGVFLQNSKVASLFFLILVLISPWTQRYFTQTWHYMALRVNALLFFLPLAPICEKIAPYLADILPIKAKTEVIMPETVVTHWYFPVEQFSEIGEITETVGADLVSTAEANPLNWTEIFLFLWVIGSIIALIWHGYCRIRLEKELKPLISLENPEIHAVLEQCKQEKKINARIKLFSSHKLYSPLLVGLFQGKILFPSKKMEDKHLEYIFSHELTHYKRGDLWWKALLTPLSVIFWWNPLIYYFMAQFELRLEYSCDEKVVEKASIKERKSYGLAILESIDEKKQEKMKLFGVSLRTPEQKLERRLKNMLKFSKMKPKTKILSGVLMSTMLLGAAAPTLAKSVEESKENHATHLMDYEKFHLNQGFSSDSIQRYPELDALILTEITINERMTEEYSLQLLFRGELELLRHGEYGQQTHEWEQQTWLTPAEITYTDGTKEDTIMTGFISGGAFGTSYDLSVGTQIQKKDVSTITYLGTTFLLESTDNSDEWNKGGNTLSIPQEGIDSLYSAAGENLYEENQQSKMVVYDQEEVLKMLLSSAKQMSQEEFEFLRLGISPDDESNYSTEEWTALMKQIMDGEIPLLLPTEAKMWNVSQQGISWSSEEDTKFAVLVDAEHSMDFSGSVTIEQMEEAQVSTFLIHMDNMRSQEDYAKILEENPDTTSFEIKTMAVSADDEYKFTTEQWADILEKVDAGEIEWLWNLPTERELRLEGIPVESFDSVALEGVQLPLVGADYRISSVANGITYYATEEGTSIYPWDAGVVTETGFDAKAGNLVVISHESGYESHYRNCKEVFVNVGDVVSQDDVIATVGMTGSITGFALGFVIYSP